MSLIALTDTYLTSLRSVGCTALTIRNRRSHLRHFVSHLEKLRVSESGDLRREHIEDFIDALVWEPSRFGAAIKVTTRNVRLRTVRSFTRWLYEHDYTGHDVGGMVPYAREPTTLPRNVPSEAEVRQLLKAPDEHNNLGFRDRMVLELLYATAMRVGELVGLDTSDIDLDANCALIRHGKGQKDRVVPLGKRATSTLTSYLQAVRPELAQEDQTALVVSYLGRRISERGIEELVRGYGRRVGLTHITPHLLRHACATHMMRRGAPLRHVQELLGHADIKNTERYTHLTSRELCEAHARYHPREQQAAPEAANAKQTSL